MADVATIRPFLIGSPIRCTPILRETGMPLVKFVKDKKEIEVPEGAVLRTEAIKAGINLNCGVNGYGESINKFSPSCLASLSSLVPASEMRLAASMTAKVVCRAP